MGVPKFFRWMADRYPAAVSGVIRNDQSTTNISYADNLYLDMNGIIHQCCPHSTGQYLDFEEIMQQVFAEIDHLVSLVKPTNLLFIAVDGVAPRAKLNQQRARRFRSSQDRLSAVSRGRNGRGRSHFSTNAANAANGSAAFDSNCITPGTQFMADLSIALRLYIEQRIREHPQWQYLTVYFSGSETPGEGEHKIISYIRNMRADSVPTSDLLMQNSPRSTTTTATTAATTVASLASDDTSTANAANIRHCILGADADMIMLALATHEPFFLVLRDVPDNHRSRLQQRRNNNSYSNSGGRSSVQRTRAMQFIRIHVLREYICRELLEDLSLPAFDRERIIDDFVFLTFLVGNDFLPSLPAINIGDSAFDVIFDAYKNVLAAEGGYLVHHAVLNFEHLELIFALIGVTELGMYHEHRTAEKIRQERKCSRAEAAEAAAAQTATAGAAIAGVVATATATIDPKCADDVPEQRFVFERETVLPDCTTSMVEAEMPPSAAFDREQQSKADYYRMKFQIELDHDDNGSSSSAQSALQHVLQSYLQGLQWCLLYYCTGCSSWSWYYPYHYGPFLHDMTGLTALAASLCVQTTATTSAAESKSSIEQPNIETSPFVRIPFALDEPLLPFQQLLACLPASSCDLLPQSYHWLMKDAASPLRGFYPQDFDTDLNGKKQDYEAVVLLPFIDQQLLLAAEAIHCPWTTLTQSERARNTIGPARRYQLVPRTAAEIANDAVRSQQQFIGRNSGNTVLVAGNIMLLEQQLIPVDIAPGACFEAQLLPGTRDSLPEGGFDSPNRVIQDTLSYLAFANRSRVRSCSGDGLSSPGGRSGGGYGRTAATGNTGRSKGTPYVNYYSLQQSSPQATEAFPMPGTTSSQLLQLPPAPRADSTTSNASTSSVGQIAAGAAQLKVSSDPTDRANIEGNNSNNDEDDIDSGGDIQVRMVIDEHSAAFLTALVTQLQNQVPGFHPLCDNGATAPFCVCFHLDKLVGFLNMSEYELPLQRDILPKVAEIFGPISGTLLTASTVGLDGTVSIKFVDVSHLQQIEQFICQRLLGNFAYDDTLLNNVFDRGIALGCYTGKDPDKFQSWLNGQLRQIARALPTFTCSLMQLAVDADTERLTEYPLVG